MRHNDKGGLLDAILTDNATESESEGSGCETLDSPSSLKKPQRSSCQEYCNITVTTPMMTDKFHGNCSLGIHKEVLNSSETSMLGDSGITSGNPLNLSLSYKPYSFQSKCRLTVDKLNG